MRFIYYQFWSSFRRQLPFNRPRNFARKSIAWILLLIHTLMLLSPLSSYALSSGAAQPEYTSFEPASATDMVSLTSGDLTYNLPLLSVPGPEGGYPLNLFYHAGIGMEQEASWTGLGWNLNVGAIDRSVIGTPDDWKQKQSGLLMYQFQNAGTGGSTDVGLHFNAGIYGDYSLGVAVDYGSYKSTGLQWSTGITIAGVSTGFNIGSHGAGFNGGYSFHGIGIKGSIGTNNGNDIIGGSVGAYGIGASAMYNTTNSQYKIGINLNGENLKTFSNTRNSDGSDGNINILAESQVVLLNLMFINLDVKKYFYQNYFFKNIKSYSTGALYPGAAYHLEENFSWNQQSTIYSGDMYENVQNSHPNDQFNTYNDLGLPAFDKYLFTAQGLYGSMTPVYLKSGLLIGSGMIEEVNGLKTENVYDFFSQSNDSKLFSDNECIYFNVENDLSSFFSANPYTFSWTNTADPLYGVTYSNGNTTFNNSIGKSFSTTIGSTERLGKGMHVDWFSNGQIHDPTGNHNGFIEYSTYLRDNEFLKYGESDGIGAYSITTKEGMTYHYSLPVYQMESYFVAQNPNETDNFVVRKNAPYAFTWLLTSITGADYIDKNNNHQIDAEDYGYWIAFEYGKWADGYPLRTPRSGYDSDKNGNNIYSVGFKQVYYLDKIKTRTHTALFIKSIRDDEQSVYSGATLGLPANQNGKDQFHFKDKCVDNDMRDRLRRAMIGHLYCGFDSDKNICRDIDITNIQGDDFCNFTIDYDFSAEFNKVRLLKLDKIVVVKGDVTVSNSSNTTPIGNIILENYSYKTKNLSQNGTGCFYNGQSHPCNSTGIGHSSGFANYKADFDVSYNSEYFNNVIDEDDVLSNTEVVQSANLIYDWTYPLCYGLPNSEGGKGKLTLRQVVFKGRNNVQTLPAYDFAYGTGSKNPHYKKDGTDTWGYNSPQSCKNINPDFCVKKDDADAWSLKEISTPSGSSIKVNFESDDYVKEAVFNKLSEQLVNLTYYASDNPSPANSSFLVYIKSDIDLSGVFTLGQNINFKMDSVLFDFQSNRETYTFDIAKTTFTNFFNVAPVTFTFRSYDQMNGIITLEYSCHNGINNVYPFSNHYEFPVPDNGSINKNLFSIKGTMEIPGMIANAKGGGIRVKNIKVEDPATGESFITTYNYNNPTTGLSSGMTSFRPSKIDRFIPYYFEIPSPGVLYEYVTVTSKGKNGDYLGKTQYHFQGYTTSPDPEAFDFKLPGLLEVENVQSGTHVNNDGWIGESDNFGGTPRHDNVFFRSSIIHNKTNKLGRLLEIKLFNKKEDLLSKTTNEYFDENTFNQGFLGQTFLVMKSNRISEPNGHIGSNWFHISTTKRDYPNALKKTTTVSNGITSVHENKKFDFYNGEVVESSTFNSYGDEILSRTLPAFHIYNDEAGNPLGIPVGFGMGSKLYNASSKNMLTQEAATYQYIRKLGETTWKPMAASIQTWNNRWSYREYDGSNGYYNTSSAPANSDNSIWRKHQNWTWKGPVDADGAFAGYATVDPTTKQSNSDFDFEKAYKSIAQGIPGWQNLGEVTLYDHYSKALEERDINSNYAATKMGYHQSLPIASASNSNYFSFTASSFEDGDNATGYFGGEVAGANAANIYGTGNEGTPTDGSTPNVHTGYYSLQLSGNNSANFSMNLDASSKSGGLLTGRKYMASVWMKTTSPLAKGTMRVGYSSGIGAQEVSSLSIPTVANGDWKQYNLIFDVPSGASILVTLSTTGGTVYFDDFRVQPINASVSSYVYDQWGQVTHILDNTNMYTRFVYDEGGRLKETWKETKNGEKLISRTRYNYAKSL